MQSRIDKIISNVRQHIKEQDFHSTNIELDKLARITVEVITSNKFLVSSADVHRKQNESINAKAEAIHCEVQAGINSLTKLLTLIDEHENSKDGIS